MKVQINRKSTTTLFALSALFVVSTACTDKKANDLDQAIIKVEERAPTQDELRAIYATQQVTPETSNNYSDTKDNGPTIAGIDELLDITGMLGPDGAAIAAFGKAAWRFIEGNKPVANVRKNSVSFMPKNTDSWAKLSGWADPRVRAYTFSIKNPYGVETVRYDYAISFSHSGNLDGKGKYLSNLTVLNQLVNVVWLWNFDADFAVTDAVNVGTIENPIPAVQADITFKVKTIVNIREVTQSFWVAGDGRIIQLNGSRN